MSAPSWAPDLGQLDHAIAVLREAITRCDLLIARWAAASLTESADEIERGLLDVDQGAGHAATGASS